jgi:mRNA interferase MazF
VVVTRFDVVLATLDPTVGSEIQKTRPCVIVSPDEMNRHLATVVVAPMTTKGHPYPSRVAVEFNGKAGLVVLDQIRAVDRRRIVRRLGRLPAAMSATVLEVLQNMFAP